MFAFFDGIMMRVTAVTLVSCRKDIKGRKSFSTIRGLLRLCLITKSMKKNIEKNDFFIFNYPKNIFFKLNIIKIS